MDARGSSTRYINTSFTLHLISKYVEVVVIVIFRKGAKMVSRYQRFGTFQNPTYNFFERKIIYFSTVVQLLERNSLF